MIRAVARPPPAGRPGHDGNLRAVPILLNGQAVGGWLAANWDPRRTLPPYGRAFVDELAAAMAHGYPGRAFDRLAPRVPRPGGASDRAPRR